MSDTKIKNLKSENILNNKFETELSGYNADQVDKFLDLILDDVRAFEEEEKIMKIQLSELKNFVADKNEEIEKYKLEISNLKIQVESSTDGVSEKILDEIRGIKRQINKSGQ